MSNGSQNYFQDPKQIGSLVTDQDFLMRSKLWNKIWEISGNLMFHVWKWTEKTQTNQKLWFIFVLLISTHNSAFRDLIEIENCKTKKFALHVTKINSSADNRVVQLQLAKWFLKNRCILYKFLNIFWLLNIYKSLHHFHGVLFVL